ncbi:hypothetical protein IKD57_00295 [Candidatus Saccharibacteria bacterium]|nr:hypothetical protein [Candidatus Saccharibacteria bacterium]
MRAVSTNRTTNSFYNALAAILYNVVTIAVTFILQSIFIKTLGAEYNGIKSLFQNILVMLSVVELGFGTAIVYNLYEPIYRGDTKKIRSIVKYYKKVYMVVGLLITFMGIALFPIVPILVGQANIGYNVLFIFSLYLVNSVLSYFLSYRSSMLHADQNNRVINLVGLGTNIVKSGLQILVLLLTKNFVLFLIVQIAMTIIYNMVLYVIVGNKYPYLKDISSATDLDIETRKNVRKKIHGLFFHKIGEFFVTGTDNILISLSKNLGVIYVGYYNNYYMVISNVALIFNGLISAATASIGNLIVDKVRKADKLLRTYRSLVLINSWMYCFGAISIYCLMDPFITLWIGPEYLLPHFVLAVLVANFYFNGAKLASYTFKTAAGVFYEDRFVPVVESIVNIVFSLIFMHFFGLAGVFIGTICSSMVLLLYSYPKYVYKKIIKDKTINYYRLHVKYTLISSVVFAAVVSLCNFINIDGALAELLVKGVICLTVPNILYLLLVVNGRDFAYLKNVLVKARVKIKK